MPCMISFEFIMVYLAFQHAIKMVVMWYDGMVSSFEWIEWLDLAHVHACSWTNQHSLHDIYVHGDLYPIHACTQCWLISMHVYDRCRSIVGRSLIYLLGFTCTKREYFLCIHFLKPKVVPYESTIPTYMRYLPVVPSKFACVKLWTFK